MTTGELGNSRRRYDKVTYTPVRTRGVRAPAPATPPPAPPQPPASGGGGISLAYGSPPPRSTPGSALTTAAMVRTLRLTPDESTRLREQATDDAERAAVDAMTAVSTAPAGPQSLAASRAIGQVPVAALSAVARALAVLRTRTVVEYRQLMATPTTPEPDDEPVYKGMARVSPVEAEEPASPPVLGESSADGSPAFRRTLRATLLLESREPRPTVEPHHVELAALGVPGLAELAREDPRAAQTWLDQWRAAPTAFAEALTRRPLEPIGLLHLERLVMTPLDVERGELVYSLPLAPKEKVTLAHREWTTHQEEFQRYVQDYLENFSERGVAEADDIAMSSSTQTRHANELSMGSMPQSTSAATLTSPVDANAAASTVDDQASREQSQAHSRQVTNRASSRSIRDQKMSFTVTTVSGVEDFTARLLENPHDDKAMRVDYFRRMRRWRTDLYRYDVRMTYDVVLPDPGRRLRGRLTTLSTVERQLAAPFTLDLQPSDITAANWTTIADRFGVALPAPPEPKRFEAVRKVGYNPPVQNTKTENMNWNASHFAEQLDIVIPDGYQLGALHAECEASTWTTGVGAQWITILCGGVVQSFDAGTSGYVNGDVDIPIGQLPTTGTVSVSFKLKGVQAGQIGALATVNPTQATLQAWRQQVYRVINEKAYADFLAERDRLRERRAALAREIDRTDPVTLRRLEREQVMLLVLEWLFPGFDAATEVLAPKMPPGQLDAEDWTKISEYGEYIKFVQTAIDWDNVLVLLYPYFWDIPANSEEKLLLEHPDPLHREFLRAGAARVVLAVQPGFEPAVVSLLDSGQIGSLDQDEVFARVAVDVQRAHARYAAARAEAPRAEPPRAEPPRGGDAPEPGILVGSWYDYTPTPALDIDVLTTPVRGS